jgi:hypothetical protein
MASAKSTVETPAEDAVVVEDEGEKFVSRDEWLNLAGHLKEEIHYVEGLGRLLLSEIAGDVRADIVAQQSVGLLADQKKIDAKLYQRTLLLNGVVDPSSPQGARASLFRPGDLDRVMKLGGGKIAEVVDHIEKLSGLGQYSGAAEGNSETSQNGGSTS